MWQCRYVYHPSHLKAPSRTAQCETLRESMERLLNSASTPLKRNPCEVQKQFDLCVVYPPGFPLELGSPKPNLVPCEEVLFDIRRKVECAYNCKDGVKARECLQKVFAQRHGRKQRGKNLPAPIPANISFLAFEQQWGEVKKVVWRWESRWQSRWQSRIRLVPLGFHDDLFA